MHKESWGRFAAATAALLAAAGTVATGAGCARKGKAVPAVATGLPVQRVVLYRNGVGYFERAGKVDGDEVKFKVRRSQVGDFLASLTVVSRDGKPVEFVTFPIEKPKKAKEETPPPPGCWPGCPGPAPGTCPATAMPGESAEAEDDAEDAVEVVVRLQGGKTAHDVLISYVVESPIWRPTYRIVLADGPDRALLQGWAVVQNTSGEDWTDVDLSVTEGAPLTFRADLADPFVPQRPLVTDRGEVVQAAVASSVSVSEETRRRLANLEADGEIAAEDEEEAGEGAPPSAEPMALDESAIGLAGLGMIGHSTVGGSAGRGPGRGGGATTREAPVPDVTLGDSSTAGALSREVIRRVVTQHRGRIRSCYEAALRTHPSLAGRVTVRFQIAETGSVTSADVVDNTTGDSNVASCIAAVARRISFPAGDAPTTVSYPFTLQASQTEGGTTARENVAPPAAPPAGLEASGARASLALLALGSQEGGVTTYRSAAPVTVADQASTLVAILNRDVQAYDALLFRPDPGVPASSIHPFRVVRFTNQTDVALERGPVAIFATERFLGQGVLEPLPAGATTSIPYAVERGVTVSTRTDSGVEESVLVKVVHGTLTIKRYSVRKTKYLVQNLTDRAGRLYIQHGRWSGWELKNLPAGSEEVDALTVIVPVQLAAQARTEIEILERSPMTQEVQMLSADARNAVRLYLSGPAVDAAAGPTLRRALEISDTIGTIDADIGRFVTERSQVQTWTFEVQNNLYAIEGVPRAGALRTRLTQRLNDLQKRFDELQTKITDLTARRGELSVELTELLREVDFEVPEPPAPAAPGPADDAAAPPAPAAPTAPPPSAPPSAPSA